LRHQELTIDVEPPQWLRRWRGEGILARIETDELARVIRRLGIPTVDVRCARRLPGVPWVDSDDRKSVALAVEHLRQRGFSRFAYCGYGGLDYSIRRRDFLAAELAPLGYELAIYESPAPAHIGAAHISTAHISTVGGELAGLLDEPGVTAWLRRLPKPIGLLAANDIRAQQVLIACQNAELPVPDDVAVIGIDNDDVLCPLCDPPLTSVEPDAHGVGFAAARLLDSLMEGETPPAEPVLVAPLGVVERRSTDVTAVADRDFALALRYIREYACEGVNVADVAAVARMSRRSLERRCREQFAKSPHDLLSDARLARLRELLARTQLTLEQMAPLAGFRHVEHLSAFFKRLTGSSPGQYRAGLRPR
jgi:LacI family transcriptional regulator